MLLHGSGEQLAILLRELEQPPDLELVVQLPHAVQRWR
jgi:hypothetical protein